MFFRYKIRTVFALIFIYFHEFFGIDFRIDFSSSFDQITSIFCIHFGISLVTFCDTFRSFFGIYFCLHFWMPFSPNIWCPLGRPWGYFSDLWLKSCRKSFGKNITFPWFFWPWSGLSSSIDFLWFFVTFYIAKVRFVCIFWTLQLIYRDTCLVLFFNDF